MIRTTLYALIVASPLVLGVGARADTGGDWPFEMPFLSQRGRIGMQIDPMTPELRGFFHVPEDRGVLVVRVDPGRPAASGGLRVGDVIVSAGGEPVRRPFDLIRIVAAAPAGEAIELGIVRDAKERTLRVEPEGEPSPWADPDLIGPWFEEKLHRGGQQLRERIEQLERRLDELERKLEERNEGTSEPTRET